MADRRPRLMTVAAAAAELDCHPETLRRAIRAGRLSCYRMGGCTRIAPEHLTAYLEDHLCPARDPMDQSSNGAGASGTPSGGKMDIAEGLRLERRMTRALDRPSRTSSPDLSVIR